MYRFILPCILAVIILTGATDQVKRPGGLTQHMMEKVMYRGINCLLILCIFMPAIAGGDDSGRDALFRVERSKNANIVQYDAQLAKDGKLDSKKPVVVYWVRLAEKGQVKKLTWIQNKFAYGFKAKLDKQNNTATLDMAAKLGRSILVKQDGKDYRAVTRIDGVDSYIEKIFVHATRKRLFTKVNYIELYGEAVDNGNDTYERFSP